MCRICDTKDLKRDRYQSPLHEMDIIEAVDISVRLCSASPLLHAMRDDSLPLMLAISCTVLPRRLFRGSRTADVTAYFDANAQREA